jgi:hypothetical protein
MALQRAQVVEVMVVVCFQSKSGEHIEMSSTPAEEGGRWWEQHQREGREEEAGGIPSDVCCILWIVSA